MSEVAINYKGSGIATMDASGTKTLLTSGKYCEDDIEVVYTRPTAPTPSYQSKTKSYTPSETAQSETVTADSGYDGLDTVSISVGAIPSNYVGSGITQRSSSDLTASGATVTVPSGYYSAQASKSVASGTAGTPTATKGSVSNHSVSVTPSVTNTTGYISGGTKTGTAVTVTASELVSGTKSITENGTGIDVTNYANVDVTVQSGKKYYATITSTGSSTYAYVKHPSSSGTKYYTAGDSFEIQENDEIYMYLSASRTDANIYVNNEIVRSSTSATNYTYTVPSATNVEISLTYGNPSEIYLTENKSELSITQNGSYDVSDYDWANVNVSGSSKNTQVVQSTTRTNASTLTAIGAELTVSTTGTYDIYYSCFRTNTSSSYTWATRLYINGTAYGTAENATWTNNQQNTHLSNISLTADDKLRVYGRNTRGTSYYVCAPMLAIVEA